MRVRVALPVGIGLTACLTLATAALVRSSEPAIAGWVSVAPWGYTGCPGPYGDLTSTVVTVTSSTGQVVTTQLGPPVPDSDMFGSNCYYNFEIEDPIPGDTLTFEVRGCSETFSSETLREDDPHVALYKCA